MKPTPSKRAVSHHDKVVERLRRDPDFATEYLRAALADSSEPLALLTALRRITEASGGVTHIAKLAGIERESLHRALSPRGNPRLSTLLAITQALSLRLTVEPLSA